MIFDLYWNSFDEVLAAVTYRLRVAPAQNGYHHFMGMFSTLWDGGNTDPSSVNACLKRSCRTGDYQMVLHFSFKKPYISDWGGHHSQQNVITNSFTASIFNGQGAGFNTNINVEYDNVWRVLDVMVFRPMLVDPTNVNNFVELWDNTNYNGWQEYLTGVPLADPNLVDGTDYELY